jgi:3-isopropylmalate dehydratase small subunit
MQLTAIDVLPERYWTVPAADARHHLFADLDRTFAARLEIGDVLIAEEHQGDAAGARPALAALRAAGVVALAARRFDPDVESAALAAGVAPVRVDAPAFLHTGDRLRVDLDAAKIVNLSSGDRAAIRNLADERRAALRAMYDRNPRPT